MNRTFKIHCSCIGKIMGEMGLTEKQLARMDELKTRQSDPKAKALTENMKAELKDLEHRFLNPELPATATSFLREWYADDKQDMWSKYTDKGNYVECDLIEFMGEQLGYFAVTKNTETREDEYFIGTCDVAEPELVDVKAPWNNKTFQDNVDYIDSDYIYQGRGYMRLWDRQKFTLFYGLMNTPAEVNHDSEVTYDHIISSKRWIAYQIIRNLAIENQIIERVKMCRTWLEKYDKIVQDSLGRIHTIEQLREKFVISEENEKLLMAK